MRVFISDTFKKKYKKVVQNNFTLQFFVNKLIDSNQIWKIYLKRPYWKLKLKIWNIHLRGVYRYIEDKIVIIPILLNKKSDKKLWNNIIWKDFEKEILFEMSKINRDIEKWNYEILKYKK
jgi:hypothetical protein